MVYNDFFRIDGGTAAPKGVHTVDTLFVVIEAADCHALVDDDHFLPPSVRGRCFAAPLQWPDRVLPPCRDPHPALAAPGKATLFEKSRRIPWGRPRQKPTQWPPAIFPMLTQASGQARS